MCKYCEKKIRNLKNAKITPQTYIGKRFGNVVIIDCYWLYKSGRNRIYVDYKCDCGTIKTSNIEHLLQGQIISCGCIKTKRTIARNKKHGLYNDNKRLFDVWNNMIQRCENSKNNSFGNYGKRGIKVCREWHDLKIFIDWAKSSGYEERDKNNRSNVLSIERIDVNGNYEPNNCKWIPVREQAWNKRNSKMCRKEAGRVSTEKPIERPIELLRKISNDIYNNEFYIETAILSYQAQEEKTYTFFRDDKQKDELRKYSWCQRPDSTNMSLHRFIENGEIEGYMSESLAEHYELQKVTLNEFIHQFVKPLVKYKLGLKEDKQC